MSQKGKELSFAASALKVSSTVDKKRNTIDHSDEVKWKFKTDIFATEKESTPKPTRRRRQTLLTNELRRMMDDTDMQFFKDTRRVSHKLPIISVHHAGLDSDDANFREEIMPNSTVNLPHVESRASKLSISSTSLHFPKSQSSKRLEDELHLHHLVQLMKVFHRAGERGSDGLDLSEFRAALGEILGEKMDSRISTMFMKIDIESGGKIGWDKFCNYMVMEYQERQLMTEGAVKVLYPHDVKVLQSLARDMFTRISFLPVVHRQVLMDGNKCYITHAIEEGGSSKVEGRFVTMSKEGNLCFWNTNFTLNKAISLDVGRLPWVTDMVLLPNASKIMVSLANNMLALFDLANNFDRMTTIVNIPFTIITMDYWYDSSDPNKAVLVTGDMAGGVCRLKFDKALVHIFGPQIGNQCFVNFKDISDRKVEGVKSTYFSKLHGDWVSKVKYWSSINHLLSCSNDNKCSLHILDLNKKRGSGLKIRKGVISFDFCTEWNIIVTGGLDKDLRLWNPYITSRPISVLKGHRTAVMHIVVNSHHGHIFSFSKDLELRVWNIGDHMCLQTFSHFQCLLPSLPTAFYVQPYTEVIMVGTHRLGVLEPATDRHETFVCDRVVSHERPLCAALYNHNFNQVVSGCHGSVVCVWDINTGEKIIQFSSCHGDKEITAMAFDSSGRRLFTGGRDGSIKAWNFNNGACILILKNEYHDEITSICCFKKKIIVGGWSRVLNYYTNSRHASEDDYAHDTIPDYFGDNVHKEDILCMSRMEPNMLASASYDGDIVLWNLDGNRFTCRLNASEYRNRLPAHYKRKYGDSRVYRQSDSPIRHPVMKDKSIEKLVFLQGRGQDLSSASLVACGSGGWVDFWNVYGGGLIGEFNVWNNKRHTISEDERMLHSVTALKVDTNVTSLLTGSSLGYIQIWKVENYCHKVPGGTRKPIITPPPLKATWRGHDRAIVCLDLAEGKDLVISASTDHCVRLWRTNGRYIGTFGERKLWNVAYPLDDTNLPHKIPYGLNRCASIRTIQTISGPVTSKWKLAKRFYEMLHKVKDKEKIRITESHEKNAEIEPLEDEEKEDVPILGRCYTRKTRFRLPIVPLKLTKHGDGKTVNIYNKMRYWDLEEVSLPRFLPKQHPSVQLPATESMGTDKPSLVSESSIPLLKYQLRKPFTEATLLPKIRFGCPEDELTMGHSFSLRTNMKMLRRRTTIGNLKLPSISLHGQNKYKRYFEARDRSDDDGSGIGTANRRPLSIGSSRVEFLENSGMDYLQRKVNTEMEGITKISSVTIKNHKVTLDPKRLT